MTDQTDQTEPLAVLAPAFARRIIVCVLMAMASLLFLSAPFRDTGGTAGADFLQGVIGLGLAWLTWRLWYSTEAVLELWPDGLKLAGGDWLCKFDEAEKLERGPFAFKPSNGFLLRLETKKELAWAPGLYWRVRNLVGIGGITPKNQTKAFADMVQHLLLERQGISPFRGS
ncbi:MAG: hypothetical protein ACPGNV_00355 [Mangrovicoccus sp.]